MDFFKWKIKLVLLFIILLFLIPLIYAGSYGALKYNAGVYGVGEVPSTPTPTPTPPSGGGGGSSCTYDWQCTAWFPSICPESETQERICMNKGTCTGIVEMPNQTQTCEYTGPAEPLFDIYLTLSDDYKEICAGNKIKANIKLENYAKVELLDAFMTYWIIDENNTLIAELKDTRAVEKETSFNIELKIPKSTPEGTYRLYAEITYSGDKTAVTGESFEVLSKEDCEFKLDFNWMYLVYGGAGIVIILFALVLVKILRRKKIKKTKTHTEYKNKIKQNLRRIKSKTFLMILVGFILIGVLFIGGNNITGFVVGSSKAVNNNWIIFGFVLIVGMIGLLTFTYRKNIIEIIENKKRKKYSKNSLKGLIKKKVYAENGDCIGKVEGIILNENKINSLEIRLDKKQKFKIRGIIVKYQDVKSVGHIVIINEKILKKLSI